MSSKKFEQEVSMIQRVLEPEEIIDIEFVKEDESGLEINLIVTPDEYIQSYVRPLGKIGYQFLPENSTIIKLNFSKGDTFKYILNLTQAN